ncbi:hypothetical protein QJQ45_018556, partial [Haematococcus lacustris]
LVKAMGDKKSGLKARCAGAQKAREVMARRRAVEAEAKAQALAAEADAKAHADAGAYEAQLHQLQADLQQREQQVADTQRLQHLQQQLQDLQQDELQRKEQQVAEQQQQLQQQQEDMHLREQQFAEQQHQVRQREQQVAQQQHQLQQQQADMQQREQQVAQQQHQHADAQDLAGVLDAGVTGRWLVCDREQPQWAMAACACNTCMSVPCQPCMKPDTTTPLEPMPMFQDTVKEVRADEECYALLMLYHPDLLHDEVCFGKLTNKHCARYRMHMGWKREEGRREFDT